MRGVIGLAFAAFLASAGTAAAQVDIYQHPNYTGRHAVVNRPVANMANFGWNNQISAVRVRAGRWQVCEFINFGGRCVTITGSIPNLTNFGWNNRISSMRPVP